MNNLPLPHAANQWMKCNGSHAAQLAHSGVQGELSQSRLEGRACHEVAQKMIAALRGEADAPLFVELVGSLSKDGTVVTQELFDAAREYVNDVTGEARKHDLVRELKVEQPVRLDRIAAGWFGIPDVWLYVPSQRLLIIWDAKFGHEVIDVVEHWPMLIYAMGITETLDVDVIEFRIVQPRAFTSDGIVRKWCCTFDELVSYQEQLVTTLSSVLSDSPPCVTGPQCKKCSARAHCDTLQRTVYESVDYAADLQTHSLSGHTLGVELKLLQRAAEMIKYRLSGLEEQALHELRSGNSVPFFGVKEGKGRQRWRKDVPVEQIIMMGDLMGQDLRKPVELDTPAQVRKKGIDADIVEQYSETPSTGLKLVPIDEKHVKNVFERK